MVLMALQWGGEKYPWSSPTVIGLFCGGAGALLAFLAWEWHIGEKAMIPFSVLRQQVVWASCLVIGLFMGSLLVFSYYLPIFFQTVKGASPTMSGVYMLPSVFSQMITAVISGVLGTCPSSPFQSLANTPQSRKTRLLHPLVHGLRHRSLHRRRSNVHLQTQHLHRKMDRLPNPRRPRSWRWTANAHRRYPKCAPACPNPNRYGSNHVYANIRWWTVSRFCADDI